MTRYKGLKHQVKATVRALEKSIIRRMLKDCGGNVTETARVLKISRKGLQLKMIAYKLRSL